jgi:hypothetical protein
MPIMQNFGRQQSTVNNTLGGFIPQGFRLENTAEQ